MAKRRAVWLVCSLTLSGVIFLILGGLSLSPSPSLSAATGATGTSYPLYLAHLSQRASAGTATPTPDLPPPITPTPITGYVCRRPSGSGICWTSASFILARGPGAPCGVDMSAAYYLTSDMVNFEFHEGEFVQVRGTTDEFPACPPLLHVVDLVVLPTP